MINFQNVRFAYPHGQFRLDVPELTVASGEKVALIGPSGSGKTTLLYLAAGILLPDEGAIRVAGCELSAQDDPTRRSFRIQKIGLVFQEFELLEYLTVRENILLPFRVNGSLTLDADVRATAERLAAAVGINEALDRYPNRLSQGERQRVAVSRALVTGPEMVFADEPTGNLDPATSRTIVELILHEADARGTTVLVVTHDHSLLDRFDRVVDFDKLLVRNDGPEVSR